MSQLKLTADGGGGTVSLKGPSSTTGNAAIELTVPGTGNATLLTSATSTGKILQVVSTAKTDAFTTSSQSLVDITGLSATITPSATSSKILVLYNVQIASNGFPALVLLRDSTNIYKGDASSNRYQAAFGGYLGEHSSGNTTTAAGQFLDSPSTTSATTYKLQTGHIHATGYTIYINRSRGDTNFNYIFRTPSSITLIEVAG